MDRAGHERRQIRETRRESANPAARSGCGVRPPTASTPSPEEGRALHARLLADDPTAPADLAAAYLDSLTVWLEVRNPRLGDPHLCASAAEDAILSLIKQPNAYNPARLSLAAYLRMAAQGDLLNLLRAERRHGDRRAALAAVELSPVVGKYLWDDSADPARVVMERAEEDATVAAPSLPGLTPEEVRVLALMQLGERKTAAYARVLGCAHLPVAEQRRAVKRVKDRLQKRLARAGGDHD